MILTDILNFHNHIYCNSLLPLIASLITAISKTLKDNIFSEAYDFTLKYRNILTLVSDHSPQIIFIRNQIKAKNTYRQTTLSTF